MILTLIVLALVGVIAFFHYVQGFFSATLSAMIAVVAAVVSFGYHEPLVRLLKGKFPDHANAIVLIGLFAIVYGLLRFLFDKYIPGNMTMPMMVEKVGAAVMGLVAGIFSVGIAMIAAQTLPFGPSIGGYTRYAVVDSGTMKIVGKTEDGPVYNLLKDEKFNTPSSDIFNQVEESHLLIPVDDLVVNTVSRLSAGGSLAAEQPLAGVHPSYLNELFFQRLGVQTGAKHVAVNAEGLAQASVRFPLYSPPNALATKDAEPTRTPKVVLPKLQSAGGNLVLIARIALEGDAADTDGFVRVGPSAVRLVANGKNYIPIGTLDQSFGQVPTVLVNKADDFIVASAGVPIDFVFQLPQAELVQNYDAKKGPMRVDGDAFIEIKRLGFVSIAGQEIKREIPPAAEKSALRKYPAKAAPQVIPKGGDTAAAAATDAPIEAVQPARVDQNFMTAVNVGSLNSDSQDVTFPSGHATLREKKFAKLEIQPTQSLAALAQGDVQIRELSAPEGMKVVQLTASTKAANRWEWADKIAQLEMADASGKSFKVNGAWGKVRSGEGEERLIAQYDAVQPITNVPRFDNGPTEVGLLFVVPDGTKLAELRIGGKRISSVDLTVP